MQSRMQRSDVSVLCEEGVSHLFCQFAEIHLMQRMGYDVYVLKPLEADPEVSHHLLPEKNVFDFVSQS